MDYKIVVTKDAEEDLDRFIQYLIYEKKSMQEYTTPPDDISTAELKQQISEMKNQAAGLAVKKKQQFDAVLE